MTFESTIAFSLAILVLAATPGPGVITSIAHALSRGFRASLYVIAGIVFGDLVFLMFAVFGLSAIAHVFGGLFSVVKVLGGLYLIWLGYRTWMTHSPTMPLAQEIQDAGGRRGFLGGLLITLGNPKVILFYAGFLPTFMDLTRLTPCDILVLMGVVAVVLTGVLATYAFSAARARHLLASRSRSRNLDRAAGAVLIGTGAAILSR